MKKFQLVEALPSSIIQLLNYVAPKVTGFFNTLTFFEKFCLVCGATPLPVYLLESQWLYLASGIGELLSGRGVALLPFAVVFLETILISYCVALVVTYVRRDSSSNEKSIPNTLPQSSPCLAIRYVPRHLLDERPDQIEEPVFNERFSELNLQDQVFIDHLPQAMEILKNNSAMLDLYHRHHEEPVAATDDLQRPKTLLELLQEKQNPEFSSTSDLISFANA